MNLAVSRRTFLKGATAATAATYAVRSIPSWASPDPGAVAVHTPLTTFAYSEVELLEGPMKRQFQQNHARFLNLDDDRLLKVFRQNAGLPAPGEYMGGWY
ncbi:MAG: twin-arginine translocation signal domain-containing protein, partial [Candidatus Sulfotelmatobacter sp.]